MLNLYHQSTWATRAYVVARRDAWTDRNWGGWTVFIKTLENERLEPQKGPFGKGKNIESNHEFLGSMLIFWGCKPFKHT